MAIVPSSKAKNLRCGSFRFSIAEKIIIKLHELKNPKMKRQQHWFALLMDSVVVYDALLMICAASDSYPIYWWNRFQAVSAYTYIVSFFFGDFYRYHVAFNCFINFVLFFLKLTLNTLNAVFCSTVLMIQCDSTPREHAQIHGGSIWIAIRFDYNEAKKQRRRETESMRYSDRIELQENSLEGKRLNDISEKFYFDRFFRLFLTIRMHIKLNVCSNW